MEEGDSFATHLNEFNTLVSQLQSINCRIQDDDKAITLLCSLPDSWDNLIMAIGSGTTTLSFDSVVAALLSEDMRRQNVDSSSKEVLMARGRTREKGTGRGTGRSKSRDKGKTRKELTCWKCGQSGHFKRECKDSAADKGKKKVEDEESSSEEEGSLYSVGSQIDSWVMDSGASFHASPKKDSMRNFKSGKFGKVRLADGKTLEITGIGDVDLKTSVGTTWTLKDVRVIPSLKKKLISVGQLDNQGYRVSFRNGEWTIVKGSLVLAHGQKLGSQYMVGLSTREIGKEDTTSSGSTVSPKENSKVYSKARETKRYVQWELPEDKGSL